jgi:ABC-type uncharacterized transport system fused permease/ATPase subunit
MRDLASQIEKVCQEHRACSMAWGQVQALVDYLCLRARVMELSLAHKPEDKPANADQSKNQKRAKNGEQYGRHQTGRHLG